MIKSSNIKQQDDILGRLNPQIMAYGSIAQVHSEVSAAICAIKARDREKQIRAMTEPQKKEFLEKRSKNVSIGAEINEELKSISEQLQTQAPEGVHVSKYDVRREKYAQYTNAGLRTKRFLNRIERYAFSLLKQDSTKIVIQRNGCITINRYVLDEKVQELKDDKLRKKQDGC
jgi:hypothetical protein